MAKAQLEHLLRQSERDNITILPSRSARAPA
ncbi:hypothetical protein [Streptomyces sp. NPDC096339]